MDEAGGDGERLESANLLYSEIVLLGMFMNKFLRQMNGTIKPNRLTTYSFQNKQHVFANRCDAKTREHLV